ncbi:hypothetical protein Emed_003231 [Eimeria media]
MQGCCILSRICPSSSSSSSSTGNSSNTSNSRSSNTSRSKRATAAAGAAAAVVAAETAYRLSEADRGLILGVKSVGPPPSAAAMSEVLLKRLSDLPAWGPRGNLWTLKAEAPRLERRKRKRDESIRREETLRPLERSLPRYGLMLRP